MSRVLLAATFLTIAWGALAFGAVYPWAYGPLAAACAAIGAIGLMAVRRPGPSTVALSAAFTVVAVAVAVQLVPMSFHTLSQASPATVDFLKDTDFRYAAPLVIDEMPATRPAHPLSIAPERTRVGLMLFAALALFLLGLVRVISATSGQPVAIGIMSIGTILAVAGIVQDFAYSGVRHGVLVYGFWRPQYGGSPFGPFINRNHFAGWMLAALPLVLGYFYGRVLQAVYPEGDETRADFSWVSTPHGARVLAVGFVCLLMGLTLLMTQSRSGIAAFGVGSMLAAWMVFRRQGSFNARLAVAATFVVLLLGTTAWAGLGTVAARFLNSNQVSESAGGRLGAWSDTLTMIGRFGLTGTGLNTYGTAMVVYQTSDRGLHFKEAHNDYLQLAAEGGLLVGVPILAAIAIFIRDVRRRFREAPKDGATYWLRAGAVVGLISIGLQSLVEFSLQMPGNAALFAVLAAVALHRSPNLRRTDRTRAAQ